MSEALIDKAKRDESNKVGKESPENRPEQTRGVCENPSPNKVSKDRDRDHTVLCPIQTRSSFLETRAELFLGSHHRPMILDQ